MKFNTAIEGQAEKAWDYLSELIAAGKIVEVIKVSPKRTLNQNAYLHLLIGAFGNHFGYTLDEAKLVYKQLNWEIYQYTKEVRNKQWTFWRSSADLDTKEMTITIDVLREMSKKAGYELPAATNKEEIMSLQNELERSGYYDRR